MSVRINQALMRAAILLAAYAFVMAARADTGGAFYGSPNPHWDDAAGLSFFDNDNDEKKLAIVWGAFGSDTSFLERFFMLRGPKFLEIHPWLRTDRPTDRAYTGRVKEITRALAPYCSRPNVECALSTQLEHTQSNAHNAQHLKLLRAEWPWSTVNNPMVASNAANIPGFDYFESHGLRFVCPARTTCIANNDGYDVGLPIAGRKQWPGNRRISLAQLRSYVRQHASRSYRAVFAWWRECNGRENSADPNLVTNQRNRNRFVTAQQVAMIKGAL